MMNRRAMMKAMGITAVMGMGAKGMLRAAPEREVAANGTNSGELPWSGLARSLREERSYTARVEGRIPGGLRGTLYMNGPGLFERGGLRKASVLDGDGMVQSFAFGEGEMRYRNRFVRTEKFVEEEAAGEYEYGSWTTRAPGGMLANAFGRGIHEKGQAGVTVVGRNGRVFAFDEGASPWEVNPESLETIGYGGHVPEGGSPIFSAHTKVDAKNGDWVLFGLEFGREQKVHLTVVRADGTPRARQTVRLPRYTYIHDFWLTERHILLHLNPIEFWVAGFLSGLRSLTDSFTWKPSLGSLWLVVDREGKQAPIHVESEPMWIWHTLNAYERRGEVIAEFVANENPDHFLGPDPAAFAVMQGREGQHAYPGEMRRIVLDPARGTARQEVLDRAGYEFPQVSPNVAAHPHRFGYFATEAKAGWSWSGVARADMNSLRIERFDFAAHQFNGEAVFVPNPALSADPQAGREPGWLLSEVYDGQTRKSFLAVFDAEHVEDGPVARVHLEHHVPLSLHGWWVPMV